MRAQRRLRLQPPPFLGKAEHALRPPKLDGVMKGFFPVPGQYEGRIPEPVPGRSTQVPGPASGRSPNAPRTVKTIDLDADPAPGPG